MTPSSARRCTEFTNYKPNTRCAACNGGCNATLDDNKSRLLKFSDKASCMQDLKVIFDDDDSEVTWSDLDLCEMVSAIKE